VKGTSVEDGHLQSICKSPDKEQEYAKETNEERTSKDSSCEPQETFDPCVFS
jgi:hypothetical protein